MTRLLLIDQSRRERIRLRIYLCSYVLLAGLCVNFGAFLSRGWVQLSFLVMGLVCAECCGRIREYLHMTTPKPDLPSMARRRPARFWRSKLEALSGKLAAKERR